MLTFEQFQATARAVDDLNTEGIDFPDTVPGIVYEGGCSLLGSGDNLELVISNCSWTGERSKLERILWACHYLPECTDNAVLDANYGGTLDDYVIGWCDNWGLTPDGDEFGQLFSGQDRWTLDEADRVLDAWHDQQRAMRWNIDETRDRENNTMHRVVVSRDDVIIAEEAFYTREQALTWREENFPNVVEG